MTTVDEALEAVGPVEDRVRDLIAKAIQDPLVQVWPDVTGHEHATLVVATHITELLDIVCKTGEGFNGLLAFQALHAALDHLVSGLPDDEPLDQHAADAQAMAQKLRALYKAHEEMDPGDLVGVLAIEGHNISIRKD